MCELSGNARSSTNVGPLPGKSRTWTLPRSRAIRCSVNCRGVGGICHELALWGLLIAGSILVIVGGVTGARRCFIEGDSPFPPQAAREY